MIATRRFSALLLAVGGIWFICHDLSAADGTSPGLRPNIVLITADDMRYGRFGIVATRIAEESTAEWPGPFGDPRTNQNAVTDSGSVRC